MTRQDFQMIARVLRPWVQDHPPIRPWVKGDAPYEDAKVAAICKDLADELAHDHPRFDRARFLAACGVQS